ncbi:hypothetical protein SAMN04487968_10163 [Nocardioides terrae]|uniref:Uncharacterized protein n=1 Tax=Nocardioides terrae TaxID=574651 RepID=A0A1I1DDE2_9ACTN|nr:hypothetical protein [Nocardioides terrae]SFB70810.1 hypothetical protein SAMN04487968_10163 [Nocardioides terrae]
MPRDRVRRDDGSLLFADRHVDRPSHETVERLVAATLKDALARKLGHGR